MTPQTAALMADYNRWMNKRVFDAAATLDEPTLFADKVAARYDYPARSA